MDLFYNESDILLKLCLTFKWNETSSRNLRFYTCSLVIMIIKKISKKWNGGLNGGPA